jgi:chemotaxis protein methyltransferase CheR
MKRPFEEIAELVRRESGVHVPAGRRSAVARAVAGAAGSTGVEAVARLLDEITVQETYFFRDEGQLRTIDWVQLYERARARGSTHVEVWAAACSTGDEAYTLALLAGEAFDSADPPVRILGTDISRTALTRAEAARYGRRALRPVPPEQLARSFRTHADGTATVAEPVRRLVRFARHNLARDLGPPLGTGPFDLVLCRNVLIYFDAETAARVVERLTAALHPGGSLLLGAADALCVTGPRLAELERRSASRRAHTPEARAVRPRPARRPAPAAAPGEDEARAHFTQGLVELERGDAEAAVASLRRALYVEPGLAIAAFKLGRAYEAMGDGRAARRAYEQTLRTPFDEHDELLQQIDLADVVAACRSRIEALS